MRFVPPTIKITVRRYRMSSEDIEKKGLGAEESNRMYESKGAAGQPENREADNTEDAGITEDTGITAETDNTAGADNPSEEDKEAETGEIARKAQEIKDRAMQIQKMKAVRNVITFLAVVISAVLQAFVIQAFIRPAELLSGGFTGIAILVEMLTSTWGISFPTSLGMLCINIPVAIICSRGISVRFTAFSLFQVFLTSGFLQFLHFEPLFDDPVLNVIFGGFLMGISIVIALKGNASSGGTDFIALYVSNKTGRSIWGQVFIGNCVLYCIFGLLFGWMNAAYSILFQFISTKTISTFHHRYDRVTLQITTEKADEMMEAYIRVCKHGISCVEAVGGYSRKKMYVLHTVISSYEVDDIIRLMREVDPHVIINVFKTEQFYGKFYHAPME
jgi:uncharacterized membrane-anchored protein YitT (DUF2179 family)